MYDELIKVLREPCPHENCILAQNAADAIEELQQIAAHYEESAHDYFKDVCYYLERVPKWIPVAERLPDVGKDVLCFCRANICFVLGWDGNHWHEGADRYYMSGFVTHWMSLPEPPKEET